MADWKLKVIELTPDKKRLTPGDRVQLGFCNGNSNIVQEHLWVRIFQVLWNGKFYLAVLETDAVSIDGLRAGQSVTFWPEHVARVKRSQPGVELVPRRPK